MSKEVKVDISDVITTISVLQIQHAIDEAVLQERKACWDAIDKIIKKGDLPGDSWSPAAERNGLILAQNIIFERGL